MMMYVYTHKMIPSCMELGGSTARPINQCFNFLSKNHLDSERDDSRRDDVRF